MLCDRGSPVELKVKSTYGIVCDNKNEFIRTSDPNERDIPILMKTLRSSAGNRAEAIDKNRYPCKIIIIIIINANQ